MICILSGKSWVSAGTRDTCNRSLRWKSRLRECGMNIKRLLWNGFFVAALALAVYLLYRIFEQYSFEDIMRSVRSIPASHFLLSILAAAASYASLTGFDYLAIRSLGKNLPYRKVALASFVSLSLGHTIGFAGLSSGAFRYRYY